MADLLASLTRRPNQQKKSDGGKKSPKLARSSRHRGKYAAQFRRTFLNKLRRIERCNGKEAAAEYRRKFLVV